MSSIESETIETMLEKIDHPVRRVRYLVEFGYLDKLRQTDCTGCLHPFWYTIAARERHYDIIRWLYEEQHLPFDLASPCGYNGVECATAWAAHYGDLEWIIYLRERGFPWQSYTPQFAAGEGHIECLRYAVSNGCPWDMKALQEAAFGAHIDCFTYLYFLDNETRVSVWQDPFEKEYPQSFVDKFDLENDIKWRHLFDVDLSKHPLMKVKVQQQRELLEEKKNICSLALSGWIAADVIDHIICAYV